MHGGRVHAPSRTNARPPLRTAFALTCAVMALEAAGGVFAHSLALLADAAHVFMDAVSIGIALVAASAMHRPANDRQTFGFARFEILAALANGIVLFAVAVLIAIAAAQRFGASAHPEGGTMAAVAAAGLIVNGAIGLSLVRAAHGDLSVKALLFHIAGDLAGEVALVLGGIAIVVTHAAWIDPAISFAVAGIIVVGVAGIVRESADVLLQSAPAHAPIPEVRRRMRAVPGVSGVHDLHVWSIGTGRHVLSAHVLLPDSRISEATTILRSLETMLRTDYGIDHATIQFECEACADDDRIVCTQPEGRP